MMVRNIASRTASLLMVMGLLSVSCRHRDGTREEDSMASAGALGRTQGSLFVDELWLNEHLDLIREGRVRMIEVFGFGEKPGKDHLPGSVSLATDEIERAPLWNLVSDGELQTVLESKGLVSNATTVFYGTDPFAVARVVWAVTYAGLEDPRWYWPGVRGWKKNGGAVQSFFTAVETSKFGLAVPARPEYRVSTDEVKRLMETQLGDVVSVRSKREYDGVVSGYSYIEAKGHIQGADWGGSASGWVGRRLDRSLEKARADLAALALGPNRPTVFYCGTGWRSSLAFLFARELGYGSVKNYDGSWLEWSRDPSNPIESR